MYMENNTIGMQLPVQTNFLVLILTPLIPSSALYMYIIYGVLIDCFGANLKKFSQMTPCMVQQIFEAMIEQ